MPRPLPILVLVDVQKEYVTEGRPFCLETIAPSLNNIRRLLAHARQKGWRVVHMRHQQNDDFFTYGSEYAQFIDGFAPIDKEYSFTKNDFSCFSSVDFQAMVERNRHREIIIVGYSTAMCCLSTLIDAHHRGHEFTFVTDATCAKRTARYSEQDMREHIMDIAGAFAHLITTVELMVRDDADD